MKVGIVAEGRGDLAVITNIIKGELNIDSSDITYLLPEYEYDQTDLAVMNKGNFSNWTLVKHKCQNRDDLEEFLNINENSFLVIHIDTAERGNTGYDVNEPKDRNADDYCKCLRTNVILKINEWLESNFSNKIAYAISIEEIEAWVMTIYNENNTSKSTDPKTKLNQLLNKKLSKKDKSILSEKNEFKKMKILSSGFSNKKKLNQVKDNNKSLSLFCESLEFFKN
jgi:hypothetical protein